MIAAGQYSIRLAGFSQRFVYRLKPSARRQTICLKVKSSQLVVYAPKEVQHSQIEDFILQQQHWLLKHGYSSQQRQQELEYFAKPSIKEGDMFLFWGQKYSLTLVVDTRFSYQLNHALAQLSIAIPHRVKQRQVYLRRKLKQIYTELATNWVTNRLPNLQVQTGLQPTKIEFKHYKRRWGCCYASGLIRINPMIMAAPDWVIDCVLIHELCHLQHLNHSQSFWQLNQQHCGRCKPAKAWLNEYQQAIYSMGN